MSHPSVHPIEAPPPTTYGGEGGVGDLVEVPRVRMKDIQGMPGTFGGLVLRILQFIFAVVSLCVMSTTSDFPSVTAFRWFGEILVSLSSISSVLDPISYLVAAVGLQSLWSLSLAIVDIYALLVGRYLRNAKVVNLFTLGDGVTSTLTFAAACASAGITVLIGNDLNNCNLNHCTRFETATAMAFLSWFAVSPSFILNFWSLASR